MRTTVFDSSAVLAFLFDEAGAEKIEELLDQAAKADKPILITAVNWTEVLVTIRRRRGQDGLNAAWRFEKSMPIQLMPVDRELAEAAAQLQLDHDLDLPRAFAAALAKSKKAELIAADPGLKAIDKILKLSLLSLTN